MSTLIWQIVFVTLPIVLLSLQQCATAASNFQTLPSLEAFSTYEDMQRYFTQRNQRSFRHIGNPNEDTYIEAFNQYNEQLEEGVRPQQGLAAPAPHHRAKRSQQNKKLPTEPKLLKFEIADAVEPSDDVKELIRQHRARIDKPNDEILKTKTTKKFTSTTESTKESTEVTTTKAKRTPRFKTYRKPRRNRRSVLQAQQPVNFKVQWIPFEASDAREPDEQTWQLIKQMRALDLDRAHRQATQTQLSQNAKTPEIESALVSQAASTSLLPATQTRNKIFKLNQRKAKRIKRSTQPEMIKFELSDAKEPTDLLKSQLQTQRESKELKIVKVSQTTAPTLLTMEKQINETTTKSTVPQPKIESRIGRTDSEPGDSDQSTHESKRLYVYKEAPNTLKSKKIINTLPHEVQKVITHMFKDNQGGKAYVKYIPAQKLDYDQVKSYYNAKILQPVYGVKLQPAQAQGHLKYVIPKPESVQVHVQPVPVVEKLRYVYTSVPAYHAPKYASIAQPIIVPEVAHQGHAPQVHAPQGHASQGHPVAEIVHHTYSAELAPPPPPAHQQLAYEQQAHEQQAHEQQAHEQQAHEQQAYEQKAREQQAHEQQAYEQKAHEQQAYEQQAHQEQHQQQEQHQPELIEVKNVVQEIQSAPFRPSKPDPLLERDATSYVKTYYGSAHIKPIEHYKYEIHSQKVEDYEKPQLQLLSHHHHHQYIQQQSLPQHQPQPQHAQPPVIKIEYHAPPDPHKQNYKSLPEFKELSTLIGKSPDDQIHGLTYLIAKEMQNKLQRQSKQVELIERPQDNKAPILFHPIQPQVPQPNLKAHVDHAAFGSMKQYIPIVENNDDGAGKSEGGSTEIIAEVKYLPVKGEEPKAPEPSSFIQYDHGHGLSGGYKVIADKSKAEPAKLTTVEHIIHHPTVSHHGYLESHYGLGKGHQAIESAGSGESSSEHKGSNGGVHYNINHSDSSKLQYASKYAFGYRIRDFNTGNDFGHKQNRDLNGVTRGQYHILLPDGRIQNVIYHADDTGFHADVSFESGH